MTWVGVLAADEEMVWRRARRSGAGFYVDPTRSVGLARRVACRGAILARTASRGVGAWRVRGRAVLASGGAAVRHTRTVRCFCPECTWHVRCYGYPLDEGKRPDELLPTRGFRYTGDAGRTRERRENLAHQHVSRSRCPLLAATFRLTSTVCVPCTVPTSRAAGRRQYTVG